MPIVTPYLDNYNGLPVRQILDNPTGDSFGRFRVSENHILLSSQQNYDKLPLVWDQKIHSNSGQVVCEHEVNRASVLMSLGRSTGDRIIRQTKRYWFYRAGQCQQALFTFAKMNPQTNVRKQIGYFDDNDGIIFRSQDEDWSFVLRTKVSGSVVDEVVNQADWNLDPMDGTGTSGVTLDKTKVQLFWLDFQWLGTGSVRCGFIIGNRLIYCHRFEHANISTSVYMRRGSLPCRYEIENIGEVTGANPQLEHICTGVNREGGGEEAASVASFCTFNSALTATTVQRSAISFRLNSGYNRAFISPANFKILNLGIEPVHWHIWINPTLNGSLASWTPIGTIAEYSVTQLNYVTSGHLLACGFASDAIKDVSVQSIEKIETFLGIAANIDGTSDILTMTVEALAGTQEVEVGMTWKEFF